MHILGAHFDYFKTMGIEMSEGREFSALFPNDTTTGIILNEAAVKMLGWEKPIGRDIQIGDLKDGQVVGVAKDFHFHSLHDPIMPLAMFVPETIMRHILIRVKPGDISSMIASLQSDWNAFAPNLPFDMSFVDEQIQQRYQSDQGFSKLIYLFSALTILIAALGLYGLIAVIASFRVREIVIRRVLGATVNNIVILLSKEFFYLVLVATLLAFPLAWWAIHKWLQDFAYRIDIQWWMFVIAGMSALAIALITVGLQSIRAAVANPVESLRSE
ncbi:MAG: ABC transporter permease [Saprospiraceae bacterium]|nr:ABC transporter permease [Saprospiraceae bacterium]